MHSSKNYIIIIRRRTRRRRRRRRRKYIYAWAKKQGVTNRCSFDRSNASWVVAWCVLDTTLRTTVVGNTAWTVRFFFLQTIITEQMLFITGDIDRILQGMGGPRSFWTKGWNEKGDMTFGRCGARSVTSGFMIFTVFCVFVTAIVCHR